MKATITREVRDLLRDGIDWHWDMIGRGLDLSDPTEDVREWFADVRSLEAVLEQIGFDLEGDRDEYEVDVEVIWPALIKGRERRGEYLVDDIMSLAQGRVDPGYRNGSDSAEEHEQRWEKAIAKNRRACEALSETITHLWEHRPKAEAVAA